MQSRWLLGVVVILAIAPALTFAAHNAPNTSVWNPTILAGPLTVCSGNYSGSGGTTSGSYNGGSFGAIPPCQDLCDLVAEIIQIIYFIIGVGIWIIVPIMAAWGGIIIMISHGDPAKASEGRKALTGAVVGVVIMLCSWLIVSIFIHFFFSSAFIPGYLGGSWSVCS